MTKWKQWAAPVIGWVLAHPVASAVAGGVLLVTGALPLVLGGGGEPGASASFEVRRGDFLISIVEGGTIESVNQVLVRSEFEGTARIIYIVPEGTYVEEGELLVELDSSQAQDQVNQQQINFEKAQFALVQAEQQLEIQRSMVESEVQGAELKVEFALTAQEKYVKGEAREERRDREILITNTLENLQIAEERLRWSEELFAKGFETKSNLDTDRLKVSQTKSALEQARQRLWLLETFDEPKRRRELEAALDEAKQNLERVKLQGERRLAQYQADVETQKNTLELSRRKLERDRRQLEACRILAPQDGLVVYPSSGNRWSSESMIEEGAVVRNRQELIRLPDVTAMKLEVKIHEAHINQVRTGQPAYVVLDAMPDRRFAGVVNKVGLVPDTQSRWGNPNLKVYATEILITDPLPDVKPGVSARAEIIITNLAQVLTVPIQAVTTRRGRQVVFLEEAPTQPVPVEVGLYNTKFIQIVSGVREGDRVLLAPPLDAEEKDLGGAILTQGEQPPVAAGTNSLARPPRAEGDPGGMSAEGGVGGRGQPGEARGPEGGRARTEGGREEAPRRFDRNGEGGPDSSERETRRSTPPGRPGGGARTNAAGGTS